ncbi:MAG: sigma-70 family RNA polymerase sigma factor [Polyangiaceae bacterium]
MTTQSPMTLASSPASIRSISKDHGGGELRRALILLRSDLHARALRMSRSSAIAEDLVQDTIERAIKFEAHYIPGTNVRAWVHQILFSVFITRCRRLRRERNALAWLSTDPNAWTVPHADAPMQALSPAIQRALDALPEVFRRAVELVDLGELAYKDAADIMGVPVGTVMSRLHRGRKLLAAELRDEANHPRVEVDLAA